MKSANKKIHEALKLPSTYRIAKSVSGHDTRNGFAGALWYELRMLTSETLGTQPVFAMSVSFGDWQEIRAQEFEDTAKAILFPTESQNAATSGGSDLKGGAWNGLYMTEADKDAIRAKEKAPDDKADATMKIDKNLERLLEDALVASAWSTSRDVDGREVTRRIQAFLNQNRKA